MVEPDGSPAAESPVVDGKAGDGKAARGHAAPRGERVMLRQVPQVQGALVSLDPTTGRVLAMSGGWNADASQFNRAIQAERQPGSSFKPMVYLTAMEQGISPSQKVLDGPFELDAGSAGIWRPGKLRGHVRRPDSAAHRAGAVAEPGHGAAGAEDRHGCGGG